MKDEIISLLETANQEQIRVIWRFVRGYLQPDKKAAANCRSNQPLHVEIKQAGILQDT